MSELMRYAARLEGVDLRSLPPVDKWRPSVCGDIDIVIKCDGTWFHEGTPIRRARLARLFSTVLKREGDEYFLVTPVEKMRIRVEDAPFVAVLMRAEGAGEKQRLIFSTNLGDEVVAGPDHAIEMRADEATGAQVPYLQVRAGLDARIARPVFYDLVALGEQRQIGAEEVFGVSSAGTFFPFGPAADLGDPA